MFNLFNKKKENEYYFYLIDDEEDVLEVISDLVESTFPCKVQTFTSIDKLLDYLKNSAISPDLIYSDVKMGEESGWRLKEKLLKSGYNIPVLHITGLTGEEGFINGHWSINKPVAKASLVKYTNLVLDQVNKKKKV